MKLLLFTLAVGGPPAIALLAFGRQWLNPETLLGGAVVFVLLILSLAGYALLAA